MDGKVSEIEEQPLSFVEKVGIFRTIKKLKKLLKKDVRKLDKEISKKQKDKIRDRLEKSVFQMTDLFYIYIDDKNKNRLKNVEQLRQLSDKQIVKLFEKLLKEMQKIV